jgi:hypothetical protein
MSEIVTLTVKTGQCGKGAIFYHEPKTQTYTGAIIPNPDYIADDCITITGDRYCPIRIIPKSSIVEGIDLPPPAPYQNENLHCNVEGSTGTIYTVNRTNNIWNCTCRGFEFRKDCKHINQVKNVYLGGQNEI